MPLNEKAMLETPIKLGTESNLSIMWGAGEPDGNSSPESDAAKGSLYVRTDAVDDVSPIYVKVDTSNSDNDWVNLWADYDAAVRVLANSLTMSTDTRLQFRDAGIYLYSNEDGTLSIVADGMVKIGDGTNQVEILPDGTITLAGTARATKTKDIAAGMLADGVTGPTDAVQGPWSGKAFTVGDEALVTVEGPIEADLTENPTLRVYWYVDEAYSVGTAEAVAWVMEYGVMPADGTELVGAAGYGGTLAPGDSQIPGTALALTYTDVGTMDGELMESGELMGLKLGRAAAAGAGPTAEPVAVMVQLRYTADRVGG